MAAKRFGGEAVFGYGLVKPSFPSFTSCRLDMVWIFFAPDTAGANADSLGRDLGAQVDGSFPVRLRGLSSSWELPFVIVEVAVSWVVYFVL